MPHVAGDVQKHARGARAASGAPPRRSPSPAPAGHPNTALPSPHPSKKQGRQTRSSIGHCESPDSTSTGCALAVNFQEVVHSALNVNAEVAKSQRFAENRMDTHKNAPLTPKGREAMVRSVTENGLSKAAAARQFNTTPKTVAKWVERFRAEGVDGLRDRSSRPLSLPSQTAPATCAAVEALRRQRYPDSQIAAELGVSPATVSRVLRRLGLNRLSALGAGRAGSPLRARTSRRDHSPRHQETRPFRANRSPHHRRSQRAKQQSRRRLGIPASRNR